MRIYPQILPRLGVFPNRHSDRSVNFPTGNSYSQDHLPEVKSFGSSEFKYCFLFCFQDAAVTVVHAINFVTNYTMECSSVIVKMDTFYIKMDIVV